MENGLCWGYERDCTKEKRLFVPLCHEPPRPWAQSMEAKTELFWTQGDFGYVKQELDSMTELCTPLSGSWKEMSEVGEIPSGMRL